MYDLYAVDCSLSVYSMMSVRIADVVGEWASSRHYNTHDLRSRAGGYVDGESDSVVAVVCESVEEMGAICVCSADVGVGGTVLSEASMADGYAK